MTDNAYPPTELEDAARCAYRRGLGAEVQYLGVRVGVAAPFSPGLGSTEALSRDEATDR